MNECCHKWVMSRTWVSQSQSHDTHMNGPSRWLQIRNSWVENLITLSSHCLRKMNIPETHQLQKLRFLCIWRYRFKLEFWMNLNLYWGIRTSRFGGFRGCSIFSATFPTSNVARIEPTQNILSEWDTRQMAQDSLRVRRREVSFYQKVSFYRKFVACLQDTPQMAFLRWCRPIGSFTHRSLLGNQTLIVGLFLPKETHQWRDRMLLSHPWRIFKTRDNWPFSSQNSFWDCYGSFHEQRLFSVKIAVFRNFFEESSRHARTGHL